MYEYVAQYTRSIVKLRLPLRRVDVYCRRKHERTRIGATPRPLSSRGKWFKSWPRWITVLLVVLFFVPISMHVHAHFELAVQAEFFCIGSAIIVTVIMCFFQAERESKDHRD